MWSQCTNLKSGSVREDPGTPSWVWKPQEVSLRSLTEKLCVATVKSAFSTSVWIHYPDSCLMCKYARMSLCLLITQNGGARWLNPILRIGIGQILVKIFRLEHQKKTTNPSNPIPKPIWSMINFARHAINRDTITSETTRERKEGIGFISVSARICIGHEQVVSRHP